MLSPAHGALCLEDVISSNAHITRSDVLLIVTGKDSGNLGLALTAIKLVIGEIGDLFREYQGKSQADENSLMN